MGSVETLGLFTKMLMTTSSMDMAKARSDPDMTAGKIRGRVISRNAPKGLAPRSLAASSREGSMPASLAFASIRI